MDWLPVSPEGYHGWVPPTGAPRWRWLDKLLQRLSQDSTAAAEPTISPLPPASRGDPLLAMNLHERGRGRCTARRH